MASGKTKSLVRAVEILDCFRSDAPELGVSEIARKLHMSRSTVGRLLATMRSLRILSQNGETRRYMLGPKVLAWSAVHGGLLDIREKSRAALEELHRLTRETASLYLLDGNERVCIDRIESRNPERVLSSPGERMPLHAGAGGKVLLAFMTPERRAQILELDTPQEDDLENDHQPRDPAQRDRIDPRPGLRNQPRGMHGKHPGHLDAGF